MRTLTRDNFNSPATDEERVEALETMRRQQHVNRYIVQTWDSQNPYVLTLGKLYSLTATALGYGLAQAAKSVGATIEHPRRAAPEVAS